MNLMAVLLVLGAMASADDLAPGTHVEVTLSNGDRLSGPLIEQDDSSVTIDHPVLGRISLPRLPRESPEPPPSLPATAVSPDDGLPENPPDPVLVKDVAGPQVPSIWSGSAGFSLNYTNNSTTTLNARLSGALNKKTKAETFNLNGWYLVQTTDGDVTQSKAFVEGSQNWLMSESPWLFFIDGQYQYNRNQSWEHLVMPNAGVGYRFLDDDVYTLTGKAGAGVRWEYALHTLDPQLYLRVDGSVNLDQKTTLNGFVQLTPAFDDPGNMQGIVQLNYSHTMDLLAPMSLTVFLQDNFTTKAPEGSESNDLTAGVGLNWDF
ncbi:MAG: DUF481 domain-containing protein [Phycisphaerales bacterium]|nr:DUF481 domain-containing protein [Phycisphaerales bacterium]